MPLISVISNFDVSDFVLLVVYDFDWQVTSKSNNTVSSDGHGAGYSEPNRLKPSRNQNRSRQVLNRPELRNRETAGKKLSRSVKPPEKIAWTEPKNCKPVHRFLGTGTRPGEPAHRFLRTGTGTGPGEPAQRFLGIETGIVRESSR